MEMNLFSVSLYANVIGKDRIYVFHIYVMNGLELIGFSYLGKKFALKEENILNSKIEECYLASYT